MVYLPFKIFNGCLLQILLSLILCLHFIPGPFGSNFFFSFLLSDLPRLLKIFFNGLLLSSFSISNSAWSCMETFVDDKLFGEVSEITESTEMKDFWEFSRFLWSRDNWAITLFGSKYWLPYPDSILFTLLGRLPDRLLNSFPTESDRALIAKGTCTSCKFSRWNNDNTPVNLLI